MCGIIGIVNKNEEIVAKAINCLEKLEYRGYDSSGITILENNKFKTVKSIGRIENLKKKIPIDFNSNITIAHTRWATHGGVTEVNAHPHTSCKNDITIVHNGIIENFSTIKQTLLQKHYTFKGETDSEVIANLISYNLEKTKNIEAAFKQTIKELKGSFALVMIFNKQSDRLYFAKNGSPLLIGLGENENFLASSLVAFSGITDRIIQIKDGENGIITYNRVEIFNKNDQVVNFSIENVKIDDMKAEKGNFPHFMLKEIYEEPDVIKRTIQEYIDINKKEILFPNFDFDLKNVDFLTIIACGTSYYAGCVAKYFLEELAGVFVNVDIASEFRYRNTPIKSNELSLFISQSGETADTLAVTKFCKEKGQKIISVVNVVQSAIAHLSDIVLKTMAGVEVGVASTKAFTAQVALLYLLALKIAVEKQKITNEEYHKKIEEFIKTPTILQNSLAEENVENIKSITKEIAKNNSLIYVGRDIFYPMALEGALKIKEITYIPSQGIASGELKHGSIALIDENSFIIFLNNSKLLFEKNVSSLEEIVARKGKIILICDNEGLNKLDKKYYKSITTVSAENKFDILLSSIIPLQLLAYYTAVAKNLDVDKPRNLAKSVTVE